MSSTRTKYDDYSSRLLQSTKSLHYMVNPWATRNCNLIRPSQPGVLSKQGVSVFSDKSPIDVESELLNLNRKISGLDNQVWNGYDTNNNYNKIHFEEQYFNTQDSRLINPPCTLKEVGWFEKYVYEPLDSDPQNEKRIFHQGLIDIQSRQLIKDNHRPKIPFVREQNNIISVSQADKTNPCIPIKQVCGVFTQPLNNMTYHSNHISEKYQESYDQ